MTFCANDSNREPNKVYSSRNNASQKPDNSHSYLSRGGTVMFRYGTFVQLTYPENLPHSLPLLHVTEWYVEADVYLYLHE
jgi:hypothetical protein